MTHIYDDISTNAPITFNKARMSLFVSVFIDITRFLLIIGKSRMTETADNEVLLYLFRKLRVIKEGLQYTQGSKKMYPLFKSP